MDCFAASRYRTFEISCRLRYRLSKSYRFDFRFIKCRTETRFSFRYPNTTGPTAHQSEHQPGLFLLHSIFFTPPVEPHPAHLQGLVRVEARGRLVQKNDRWSLQADQLQAHRQPPLLAAGYAFGGVQFNEKALHKWDRRSGEFYLLLLSLTRHKAVALTPLLPRRNFLTLISSNLPQKTGVKLVKGFLTRTTLDENARTVGV